jgi:hypothetical protein
MFSRYKDSVATAKDGSESTAWVYGSESSRNDWTMELVSSGLCS